MSLKKAGGWRVASGEDQEDKEDEEDEEEELSFVEPNNNNSSNSNHSLFLTVVSPCCCCGRFEDFQTFRLPVPPPHNRPRYTSNLTTTNTTNTTNTTWTLLSMTSTSTSTTLAIVASNYHREIPFSRLEKSRKIAKCNPLINGNVHSKWNSWWKRKEKNFFSKKKKRRHFLNEWNASSK